MTVARPLVFIGFGLMVATAMASAIWPSIAVVVSVLFGTVLIIVSVVPVALAVRWVRGELAWRRELRALGPIAAEEAVAPEPVVPTLAQLRESA